MPEKLNAKTPEQKTETFQEEAGKIMNERKKLDEKAARMKMDLNNPDQVEKSTRKNPQTSLNALRLNTETMPELIKISRETHDKINQAVTEEMRQKVNETIGQFEVTTRSLGKARVNPKTVMEWGENLRNLHKLGFSALHNAYPGVTDHWLMRIANLLVNGTVSYWAAKGMATVYEETGHMETEASMGGRFKIGANSIAYDAERKRIKESAEPGANINALYQKQYDDLKDLSIGELFLNGMTFNHSFVISNPQDRRRLNLKEYAAFTAAGPNQHGILTKGRTEEYQKQEHFHVMDTVYFLRELMYAPGYMIQSMTWNNGDPYTHMLNLMKQGKTPDLSAIVESGYRNVLKEREKTKPMTDQEKTKLKDEMYQKAFRSLSSKELKTVAAFQIAQVITGAIDPAKAVADYLIFGKENSELLHIKLPGGIKVYAPKIYTWMGAGGYSAEINTSGKIGDKIYVKAGGEAAFIGDDAPEVTAGIDYRGENIRASAEATVNPKLEYYGKARVGTGSIKGLSVFGEMEASQGTMRGRREFPQQGIRGLMGLRYEF